MKLSERIRIGEYYGEPPGKLADEVALLEARLEAVECGECGKSLLECDYVECDKKASQ